MATKQKSGGGVEDIKELKNYVELSQFHSKGTVVVDFYRTSCKPCSDFAPTFAKLSTEFSGKVKFAKINLQTLPEDQEDAIMETYNLHHVPTFVLFRDGSEVSRVDAADALALSRQLRAL